MISLTGEYALRAMARVAQLEPGQYVLVRDIGKELDIPAGYLGKVMLTLTRAGLLESQRGRNGGFRLSKPARAIKLYDILSAAEPVKKYESCLLGQKICCDETACPIHFEWKAARGKVVDLLKETPLTSLAEHRSHLKPADLIPRTKKPRAARK
ncbi:MAG TPA: Rrf2 family transcriptional regulator [Planctomycetota bacterium]|nr:Rrf2 family transcriptional regulator [Planctomycetota bacterium]